MNLPRRIFMRALALVCALSLALAPLEADAQQFLTTTIAPDASIVFRDYLVNGVPSSGAYNPKKSDIRQWGAAIGGAITQLYGVAGSGAVGFSTLALLAADLAYPANTLATVFADSTVGNNGVYLKVGASSSGSWTQVSTSIYGLLPSWSVGSTTTLNPGSAPTVAVAGTPASPYFNFGLPTTQVLALGTVSSLQAGSAPTASFSGTATNPLLNLNLPTTQTLGIGTITTASSGTPASATLSGTTNNPLLNLTIPRGATGGTIAWRGAWSSVTAYAINDAVFFGGASYIAVATSTNVTPVNGATWNTLAASSAFGCSTSGNIYFDSSGSVGCEAPAALANSADIFNVVTQGGAACDGTADDGAIIQAALTAQGSSGGGGVYLPGMCESNQVLVVPSNVTLFGAGFGTGVRSPAGALGTKTVDGVSTNSSIVTIGTVGVTIRDLTVDHVTNASLADGIQCGGASPTVTSGCLILHDQVLGYGSGQYEIWLLRSIKSKALNNDVQGNYSSGSFDHSGIEVFGANDVEVAGNSVSAIGNHAILAWEDASTAATTINNVNFHDNTVNGANVGYTIICVTTCGNIAVHHNSAINTNYGSSQDGIVVQGNATSPVMNNVDISDNRIFGAGNNGVVVELTAGTTGSGVTVKGNTIGGLTASTPTGILVQGPGVIVAHNDVDAGAGLGIFFNSATNGVIDDNDVATETGGSAASIYVDGGSTGDMVHDNRLKYVNIGVVAAAGATGTLLGNTFTFTGSEVAPVSLASGFLPYGNILTYTPTIANPFGAGADAVNYAPAPTPTLALAGGTCAGTVIVGGKNGTVTLTGACAATNTLTLSVMPTQKHGYTCEAHDRTTPATLVNQTGGSTTSAVFTFAATTSGSTDVIQYDCRGF